MNKGKLLLFIKDKVVGCAPKREHRLDTKKQRQHKRKAESPLPRALPSKQRKRYASAIPMPEKNDNKACSDVVLMYNTVRGYSRTSI
jgi:IS5 family transposase